MKAPARTSARIASRQEQTSGDDLTQDPFSYPKHPRTSEHFRGAKDTCQVCGDVSTGFRYGAITCNACGQFFLKCCGKNNILPCEKDEKCVLTSLNRNNCRYCRFQKCLEVGMTEDVDSRLRKRRYSEHDDGPEWDIYPVDDNSTSSSNELVGATPTGTVYDENKEVVCAVCGAESVGMRYGAESCNACADFFFKFGRNPDPRRYKRNCVTDGKCVINMDNRADCPFCRIKKCLAVGMAPKTNGGTIVLKSRIAQIDQTENICVVCGDEAIGSRFGKKACRPCEEFFHRIINKDAVSVCPTLECIGGEGECHIFISNRSDCRYCRFKKCLKVGMVSISVPITEFLKFFESKGSVEFVEPIGKDNDIPVYFLDNNKSPIVSTGNFCAVCGAPSIGKRWGAESCDPCSQFFYVTWPNRHIVRCKEGMQQCEITPENRYSCRYCRMEKCIAVGMDASGFGTRSSSSKKSKPEDTDSMGFTNEGSTVDWETNNLNLEGAPSSSNSTYVYPLAGLQYGMQSNTKLDMIIQRHKESCAYTSNKMQTMLEKSMEFVNIPTTNNYNNWQFYCHQMDLEIRQILQWIQCINIGTARDSIFKIFVLRIARALSSEGMFILDGRFMDYPMLDVLFGVNLARDMLQVAETVRNLGLNDDDIALFIALVHLESKPKSLSQELSGAQNPSENFIAEIRKTLETHVQDFHTLMGLIPKLDEMNRSFQASIVPFLFSNRQSLQLPQVYLEVFEVPIPVSTPNLL